jgi:hypothetical protein
MIAFNQQNFAEICRQARRKARSLEPEQLLGSLLVEVRIAIDFINPSEAVALKGQPVENAYIEKIGQIVRACAEQPKTVHEWIVETINKELLVLELSENR